MKTPQYPKPSTWAEVDLSAVQNNFRQLKKIAGPSVGILSVVKAQAYGHGAVEVAKVLEGEGSEFFGVADLDEAIELRRAGIRKPILVFENILPANAKFIADYNLTATVCTLGLAQKLNSVDSVKKPIKIHVKVDTGMGRLGVWYEEAAEFIAKISRLKNLRVEGIYTHFANSDYDREFTRKQIAALQKVFFQLKTKGISIRYVHANNSTGVVFYRKNDFNLVRPGLMLYGMCGAPFLKSKVKLKPALSVKSRILFLKKVERGRSISYGRTFTAPKKMKVATLPIGYNDGYFRIFSNNAFVLVGGKRCPVVGRVTMDQTMVDVSKVKSVKIGDEAVLLGRQKDEFISAEELAARAGTINYEITCSLGNRLPRVYK